MRRRHSSPPEQKSRAAGEPAVIQRLPENVDYTFVKMIMLDVPAVLTMRSWMKGVGDEPPWSWFQTKSYRAIDRSLQRLEKSLPPDPNSEARLTFRALRAEFVKQVLDTIRLEAGRTKRWLVVQIVHPSRFPEGARPPGPFWMLTVWKRSRSGPILVAGRVLPSAPSPAGIPGVAWFEPEQIEEIYRAVFREYFPDVLRLRPGQHWRTNREPTGWPLIAQFVIPKLYDYLRPYYKARRYRHEGSRPSAGHYPLPLRQDICDLICVELPHLAQELTVARVTAAIQRHVATAPEDRPMGREMFVVWKSAPENRVT